MNSTIKIDLFVEDRAHEEFIQAMLLRLANEEHKAIIPRVRSSRGGHGQALSELSTYLVSVSKGIAGMDIPDLLVVAIDANCKAFNAAHREIESRIGEPYKNRTIIACPDPHIERWFLADPDSLVRVIGLRPKIGKKKCQRDHYKSILIKALIQAGYLPTLGGIEFAREIVLAMDLYRASKAERSLKHFLDDATKMFKTI